MATKTRLKTALETHSPSNSALQQMTQPIIDSASHSRIIEMAWEDRTPFEAIQHLYGLSESEVIRLMRRSLKTKAFKNWRQRALDFLSRDKDGFPRSDVRDLLVWVDTGQYESPFQPSRNDCAQFRAAGGGGVPCDVLGVIFQKLDDGRRRLMLWLSDRQRDHRLFSGVNIRKKPR